MGNKKIAEAQVIHPQIDFLFTLGPQDLWLKVKK